MRRHLNTLYVTSDGAWLTKDGANVVVSSRKADACEEVAAGIKGELPGAGFLSGDIGGRLQQKTGGIGKGRARG